MTDTPPVGNEAAAAGTTESSKSFRMRWAAALFVGVWCWTVAPRLIQTLTQPKFRASVGEESVVSPLATIVTLLASVGVIGLCAVVVVVCLAYHHPGRLLALSALVAPWAYLVMRDLFTGHWPTVTTLVYPAVMVALWLLRPPLESLGVLGYLLGFTVVLNLLLGFLLPSKGIFFYSPGELVLEDKATLPMGILIGIFTHGNTLGTFLALAIPVIALVPHRRARVVLVALAAFALFWSASRGSFGAIGLGLLALAAIALVPTRHRRGPALVVGLVPVVAAAVIPFVVHDPTAFTNRGFIWQKSIDWWQHAVWAGLGSDWYNQVGQTSARLASSAFHGHNQLVQSLVTGGLLLAVLMLALVVVVAVRAATLASRGQWFGLVHLVVIAGCSALERPFSFVDNFGMFAVVALPLAVLVFADLPPEEQPDAAPDGDDADLAEHTNRADVTPEARLGAGVSLSGRTP